MADNKRRDFDLYFNGRIILFDNGDQLLVRDKVNYSSTEPDIYHNVIQGDTITFIAWFYYKKFTTPKRAMRYWKYIADVNNITNPLDLDEFIGKQIIIPDYNLARLSESE